MTSIVRSSLTSASATACRGLPRLAPVRVRPADPAGQAALLDLVAPEVPERRLGGDVLALRPSVVHGPRPLRRDVPQLVLGDDQVHVDGHWVVRGIVALRVRQLGAGFPEPLDRDLALDHVPCEPADVQHDDAGGLALLRALDQADQLALPDGRAAPHVLVPDDAGYCDAAQVRPAAYLCLLDRGRLVGVALASGDPETRMYASKTFIAPSISQLRIIILLDGNDVELMWTRPLEMWPRDESRPLVGQFGPELDLEELLGELDPTT